MLFLTWSGLGKSPGLREKVGGHAVGTVRCLTFVQQNLLSFAEPLECARPSPGPGVSR